MAGKTREKLLDVALELFAQRGFDGVSIAAIADRLGFSKQALLHHFASKEKLYGEVLGRISADFERRLEIGNRPATADAVADLLVAIARDSREHQAQTALLMRELLDNSERAESAGRWYLRGFLNTLMDQVQAIPGWRDQPRARVAAIVYQLLGAINYFAISRQTLGAMFGPDAVTEMAAVFDDELRRLVLAALELDGAADAAGPRA